MEINEFAQLVLRKRMQEGLLHRGRVHSDVTTFQVSEDTEACGVGGGFPCQVSYRILELCMFISTFKDFG